jgi:hypothetical protein
MLNEFIYLFTKEKSESGENYESVRLGCMQVH